MTRATPFALAYVLVCHQFVVAGDERPNIVCIVADDLGWADVAWHNSAIPTPHLDALRKGGLELDQHYVAPVCTPTRAALLTGRYWSRFGNTAPSNPRVLPWNTITLAKALQSSGYRTGLFGKWHLGSMPEWGPQKFGFDRSYGSLAGGVTPYTHRYKKGDFSKTWHRDAKRLEEEGHVTDLIAAEAVGFISKSAKSGKPFFCYVPFSAVHHPIAEPKEWVAKAGEAVKNGLPKKRQKYAACVMHMDDAVGRIVKSLEQAGVRKNTLIVFFSDNGGQEHANPRDVARYPGENEAVALGENDPLRGAKGSLFEGGIRVAALANWPGKLAPRKVKMPIHVIDWMPTFLSLARFKGKVNFKWDGQNIWPHLVSSETKPAIRELYWAGPGFRSRAVRRGDWKMIQIGGGKAQLFNLAKDPYEKRDVSNEHKTITLDMLILLKKLQSGDNQSKPRR